MPGPILLTRIVTYYSTMAGRLLTAMFIDPSPAQWIPSLWAPYKTSAWQATGNRCYCEPSCLLLATDTWHRFLPHWNTSLGATVGQMLKCQWLIWGGLTLTICYSSVCYIYIKVRMFLAAVCLRPYFFKVICIWGFQFEEHKKKVYSVTNFTHYFWQPN